MFLKKWTNPMFVGLLILFSLPLKLPALQQMLEGWLSFSFPIRLSLYTLFLPPVALFCLAWNRKRTAEIWQKMRYPLIVLAFLFVWMWLGAIMSDYPKIALKHSGRYSIYLLTFLAFLFALERESLKNSCNIFTGIYVLLAALTFLDWHGKTSIPDLLAEYGLHIDLFFRHLSPTSFFENRNPYAVASVGVFFWSISRLKHSWFLSSLGIVAALYSIAISGSRNGTLTMVLCFLFLLILTFKQIRKARTVFMLVLSAAIVVGIGYYSIKSETTKRTNVILNKLLNVKTYKDLENLDLRFALYRSTFDIDMKNLSIYAVTIASSKFLIDGSRPTTKLIYRDGDTYIFDQSDSTNSGHILQFSQSSDNSGASENANDDGFPLGMTLTGTPGSAGAKTTIVPGTTQVIAGYFVDNATTITLTGGSHPTTGPISHGMSVTGTGIQAGTTILNIASETTAVISLPTESTEQPVNLTFSNNDTLYYYSSGGSGYGAEFSNRGYLETTVHNILGSGTKTFGHEVIGKSNALRHYNTPTNKTAYNAHNALLTIWIEMGWVGLIAVLLFLWLWFRPALRGPPLLMMPMLSVCVGQILDYFVWEIFFMAFQSFFFASFASSMYFVEGNSTSQSSDNSDY